MKKKILFWLYQLIFISLLIAGVTQPDSWLIRLPVVCLWISHVLVWTLCFFGCAARCAGGTTRREMEAALRPFFSPPKTSFLACVRGWAMRLLIVLSLAYTGWLLTLVCYVITVLVYLLVRSALSEPVSA